MCEFKRYMKDASRISTMVIGKEPCSGRFKFIGGKAFAVSRSKLDDLKNREEYILDMGEDGKNQTKGYVRLCGLVSFSEFGVEKNAAMIATWRQLEILTK